MDGGRLDVRQAWFNDAVLSLQAHREASIVNVAGFRGLLVLSAIHHKDVKHVCPVEP